MLVAALLVGIGGLLAMAGLSVACAALVAASRRWYHRVDLPPHEIARLKWEQAKAAAGAGAGLGARPSRSRTSRGASGRPPDLTDGRVLDLKRRSTREWPLSATTDGGHGHRYAAPKSSWLPDRRAPGRGVDLREPDLSGPGGRNRELQWFPPGVDQHQEVVVQQVAAVGARPGASVPSR